MRIRMPFMMNTPFGTAGEIGSGIGMFVIE